MELASLTQVDCELIRRFAALLPVASLGGIPVEAPDEVAIAVAEHGQYAEPYHPQVRRVLDLIKSHLEQGWRPPERPGKPPQTGSDSAVYEWGV
jgi:hypothetical protein